MMCVSHLNRTGAVLRCEEEDVVGYFCHDISIRYLQLAAQPLSSSFRDQVMLSGKKKKRD